MTRHLDQPRSSLDRDLDALGNGGSPLSRDLQDVAAFLTQLRGLGDRPAPPPSAELASILDRGFTPKAPTTVTTSRARRSTRPSLSSWLRRGALAFALSAGLSASVVGAAAASGQLPDGARDVVDRIVEAFTPFDVRDVATQEPLPTVDDSPVPVPSPRAAGAEHDTRTVPSFGNDTPAEDGVKRGSGQKSAPRTEHDGDSATETHAEPTESAGRDDRSGSSDEQSDDDGADHDADTVDEHSDGEAEDESGGASDGGSAADEEGSEDVAGSGAEPDQAE